jgi:MFS family permease
MLAKLAGDTHAAAEHYRNAHTLLVTCKPLTIEPAEALLAAGLPEEWRKVYGGLPAETRSIRRLELLLARGLLAAGRRRSTSRHGLLSVLRLAVGRHLGMHRIGYRQAFGLFSRNVWLWFAAWVTVGLSQFGLVMVVLNLYLLRLGYGTEFIGTVQGLQGLLVAAFALPAGILGSKVGSRRVMISGLAMTSVGTALLPLADVVTITPGARSVWLLAATCCIGLGFASYMANTAPSLAGYTGTKDRGYAFSLMTALMPFAGFFGSIVGGFMPGLLARTFQMSLDDPGPYRFTLFVPAALYLLGMVFMIQTSDPETAVLSTQRKSKRNAKTVPLPLAIFAVIALVSFSRTAGTWFPRMFFNVYLDEAFSAPPSLIGGIIGLSQLGMVPLALFAPAIAPRIGRERSVYGSLAAMALATLPLALVPTIAAAGFGLVFLNMAFAFKDPTFKVYQQEIVPPPLRAPMQGAAMGSQGLGSSLMMFGGGFLVPVVGYTAVFLLSGAFSLCGFLLFALYFRVPRGEFAKTTT